MGRRGKQSRYFETAEVMDATLLELLADKELEFITVKEICAHAGVNRSTFYLHYETIDDLLRETAEFVNRRFAESMGLDTTAVIGSLTIAPKNELLLVTPRYLMPYLRFIEQNKRLFTCMLKRSSVLQLRDSYDALCKHVFEPILNRFAVPERDRAYLMRFFISGLMAIVEQWLENDCDDDVEHIAALMEGLVNRTVNNA